MKPGFITRAVWLTLALPGALFAAETTSSTAAPLSPDPLPATAEVVHMRSNNHALQGVLGNNVGLTVEGHTRLGFVFGENFDLDKGRSFHTLNYVHSAANVKPTLWISEVAQVVVEMDLLPDIRWGGQTAWLPQFTQGYLQFITTVGRFRLGRQTRTFGMKLAWYDRADDNVPFGFLHGETVEDRMEWDVSTRFGATLLHANLGFAWIEDPQASNVFSKSDHMRYSAQVGTGLRDKLAVEALLLIDRQASTGLTQWDVSLYADWQASRNLAWDLEAGLRRGSTQQYTLYDPLARTLSNPALKLEGYRIATRLRLQDLQSAKGVRFGGTELKALFAAGTAHNNIYAGNTLRASGTSESACGCLIASSFTLPQLRAAWQQTALPDLNNAGDKTLDSFSQAWESQGWVDGFIIPSAVWAIGYKDFDSRLGFYYIRAAKDADSRILLSDAGTTGYVGDDAYKQARTLGYELDLGLRYTFYEHIEVGLDAGLLFGGDLLDVQPASNGPAYMLLPRLTVSF